MNLKGRNLKVAATSAANTQAQTAYQPKFTQTQNYSKSTKQPAQKTEVVYSDNEFQTIDKIEIKGARVEFLNSGFGLKKDSSIGKVRINFQKLDDSNHQIAFGSFYLGFDEIYELDEFIQHDLADKYVESKSEAEQSGSKYCTPIYTKYAGAVNDSGVISRVLELTPGTKEDLVITYKEGPGVQNQKTKLITPAGKMTKFITCPLSVNRLISIVASIRAEIIAYKAAIHVEKQLELNLLISKCE